MATISYNKGNNRYKMMVSKKELNALTIATALLNVVDMETEAKEQGLDLSELEYDHLTLFDSLTKITKLYQVVPEAVVLEGVESNETL